MQQSRKTLADEDHEICVELEALLSPEDAQHKEANDLEVMSALCAFDERLLYALSEHSPKVREFCERKDFNEKLVESKFYPSCLPKESVRSVDGVLTVKPFHQLMGYYLVLEAKKEGCKEPAKLLDEACDRHAYHALVQRMEMNVTRLQELKKMIDNGSSFSDIEIINAPIRQIIADAEKIGNVYRSLGYFMAATFLLEAARLYFEFPGVKEAKEMFNDSVKSASRASPSTILPAIKSIESMLENLITHSMKYFYLSFFSAEYPASKSLIATINAGNDLLAGMSEYFTGWSGGEEFFKKMLPMCFDLRSPAFFSKARGLAEHEVKAHPLEFSGNFRPGAS